jgi:hypothetical protein
MRIPCPSTLLCPLACCGFAPPSVSLAADPSDLYDVLQRTCLAAFMPKPVQEVWHTTLTNAGIAAPTPAPTGTAGAALATSQPSHVTIAAGASQASAATNAALVPATLFFEIPAHLAHLRSMAKDLAAGVKHLLVLGNQGMGQQCGLVCVVCTVCAVCAVCAVSGCTASLRSQCGPVFFGHDVRLEPVGDWRGCVHTVFACVCVRWLQARARTN